MLWVRGLDRSIDDRRQREAGIQHPQTSKTQKGDERDTEQESWQLIGGIFWGAFWWRITIDNVLKPDSPTEKRPHGTEMFISGPAEWRRGTTKDLAWKKRTRAIEGSEIRSPKRTPK